MLKNCPKIDPGETPGDAIREAPWEAPGEALGEAIEKASEEAQIAAQHAKNRKKPIPTDANVLAAFWAPLGGTQGGLVARYTLTALAPPQGGSADLLGKRKCSRCREIFVEHP